MKTVRIYYHCCQRCLQYYRLSKLKQDCFDENNLLCEKCYNIRTCFACSKELHVSWFHKDNLNHIVCHDCSKYNIEKCQRCEKLHYDKNLIYCDKEKQTLCERCHHYILICYENEQREKMDGKQ
jgi:hypothetical protein